VHLLLVLLMSFCISCLLKSMQSAFGFAACRIYAVSSKIHASSAKGKGECQYSARFFIVDE